MNVLESLKIKDATILNLKENDILFVKVKENCSERDMIYIQESLAGALMDRGFENIDIWIASNVDDVKIIRR